MKRLIGIAALTLIAVLTAGCGTQSPGAVSSALASSGVTLPTTCDEAFIAARDAGTATDEQLNAIVATCGSVEAIAQKAAQSDFAGVIAADDLEAWVLARCQESPQLAALRHLRAVTSVAATRHRGLTVSRTS